jgi:predicted DNA-binding transcriptional regulator AlpA
MADRATVTPRCLRREDAAHYIGVSPTTFDAMVKAGDMPEGFTYPGRAIRVWGPRGTGSARRICKGR